MEQLAAPTDCSAKKPSGWIDISRSIYSGMAYWPDNPPVRVEPVQCLADGDICNVSKLTLGSHTGTHVDGLNHFIKGGVGVDQMPLEATIGPARLIEITHPEYIPLDQVEPHNLQAGERILFKTQNSTREYPGDRFIEDFIYLSTEAAQYLAERQVRTIGVDYLSVGGYEKNVVEVHKILLGQGIWVIEGLDLAAAQPGGYELICLPLKLKHGDGGLARAVVRSL
ncbi:cyclase family protein [Romeria aff. gracilis LEGE 07310]|uniref:Kynurenine formamidase n=1 Tax=Vasconcelosia minhoensis LEGE 07310 TaxID=915328 RepID=A0A8J7AEE9_9CYAN|nr:cyclase family protein [Romeria gracilis]MBE9077909.1 cyclase family protein [Romeria aff. gracilis LEGE 07310]